MDEQNETEVEERKLNEFGEDFIAGRSRRNAQRALDAADEVGVDQIRVRAVRDGYFAPPEVVDRYAEMLQVEVEAELAAAAEQAAEAAAKAAAEAEAAKSDEIVSTGEGGEPAVVETAPAAEGDAPAEVTPAGTEGVEIPEGDPTSKWNVKQIDAWAARQDPPILFAEDAVKADKLRAIDAAVNQEKE